jgi:hypothetical protein
VDDHHLQDNLRVFPNPCTNTIHVEVKLNEINRIDIYNTSGIKLISQTYSPAEKTLAVIGLENLVPGIYIMDIVSGNSHSITKFVKR